MRRGAGGWYRVLLGLLPGSLREGFEEEMVRDFLARLGEARGLAGRVSVWTGAVADLIAHGVAERLGRRSRWGSGTEAAVPRGRGSALEAIGRDLRFAARTLRRDASFAATAVVTLALGIGASTVAFSLVKSVLLRPLPFPADQELVVLREHHPDGQEELLSFPNFDDFRNQARTFQGIAALRFASEATVLSRGEPARGVVVPVSREFFTVLGVMPVLGRPILPEENREGGDPVAVLGWSFWRRFLGGEEGMEGLAITVDGSTYAVVGVMPPGFRVFQDADIYLPGEWNAFRVRSSSNFLGIGRLAEGATLPLARAELDRIVTGLRERYPDEARLDGVALRPLREEVLGAFTRPLLILLGASGILLLLACSNVASTLMARGIRREREMAIRAALGGGRVRLVRLLLTESLVLAGLAGLAGVGLSLGALEALKSAGGGIIPRLATVGVDAPVLAFALGTTLVTSLLFGLLPALRLPPPGVSLRSGSGGNTHRSAGAGWSLLVGGQVALTLGLAVASGLLLRSLGEILAADTHIRSEGTLTVALDLSTAGLASPQERAGVVAALQEEWLALPGVTEVGFVSYLPQRRGMMTGTAFRPPLPAGGLPDHYAGSVGWRVVDADYFRAMGIPLLGGRYFGSEDGAGTPPVIVLNEPLARMLFPDREAVGGVVQFDPFWRDAELEVVGVVAEARDWRVPAGEQLEGYVLVSQRPNYARELTAVIHGSGDPGALIGPARERLRAVLPAVPGTFRTMESLLADSFRDRSFTLGVLGTFALLSLLLSAVGISGVVSYSLSSRTREIGIMLALGAGRGEIRGRFFLRTAGVVGVGIVAGLGLAVVTGELLRSLLYEVAPRDPVTLVMAPLVLMVAASLAILVPVVRYTRVDPVRAMRLE